jgi:hypothetical protein
MSPVMVNCGSLFDVYIFEASCRVILGDNDFRKRNSIVCKEVFYDGI